MQALIFGSTGALGNEIRNVFLKNGWKTHGVSRTLSDGNTIKWDTTFRNNLSNLGKMDAVVFAQGLNANDSIQEHSKLQNLFEANVLFIADAIAELLDSSALNSGSRITIIGSIWQDFSKSHKFSYSVSKSALNGLMNSAVADLSERGISINTIAPGVVDTPMTRANLSAEQIAQVTGETPSRSLVTAEEVASATFWVSTPSASGINGQTIRVDNGWSNVRKI